LLVAGGSTGDKIPGIWRWPLRRIAFPCRLFLVPGSWFRRIAKAFLSGERSDNEMPSADRTLREIEAMRQAGTITREEANQRRLAVLKSLPTTQDSDPDS
jgi:hypothetical protein